MSIQGLINLMNFKVNNDDSNCKGQLSEMPNKPEESDALVRLSHLSEKLNFRLWVNYK